MSNNHLYQLHLFCCAFRDGTPESRARLLDLTLQANENYKPILQYAFSKLNLNYEYPSTTSRQKEDLEDETSLFGICRSLTIYEWFVCGKET
jgi:hypothetical protein